MTESDGSGGSLKVIVTCPGALARFEPGLGVDDTGSEWAIADCVKPAAASKAKLAARKPRRTDRIGLPRRRCVRQEMNNTPVPAVMPAPAGDRLRKATTD